MPAVFFEMTEMRLLVILGCITFLISCLLPTFKLKKITQHIWQQWDLYFNSQINPKGLEAGQQEIRILATGSVTSNWLVTKGKRKTAWPTGNGNGLNAPAAL